MSPSEIPLALAVEAVLLTAEKPLAISRIIEIMGHVYGEDGPGEAEVLSAIATLNERYDAIPHAIRIEKLAAGYRVMTRPELSGVIAASGRLTRPNRLSRAALETLSIIAYRQPVTRADLESIRGVACGEVLKSLMERKLITISGRAEEVGRPMLYATTRQFLDTFGLSSLRDLPGAEQDFNAENTTHDDSLSDQRED